MLKLCPSRRRKPVDGGKSSVMAVLGIDENFITLLHSAGGGCDTDPWIR